MPKKQPPIEPAYSILYAPTNLPASNLPVDASNLLARITPALGDPFNERQQEAFARIFNERVSLIWGPPGTGKTTVLAGAILGWLAFADETGKPIAICVGASNYNAIDKVLNETIEIYERYKTALKIEARFVRVRSPYAPTPTDNKFEDVVRGSDAAATLGQSLNEPQTSWVIGGTYRQLGKMAEAVFGKNKPTARWFDLLVIDEASQMPVAAAGAYFLLLKENGNFVSAGDHFQLGPIYGFEMRRETDGEGLYDCIFTYLKNKRGLSPTALNDNYRNNGEIAEWSKNRFYTQGFIARNPRRRLEIPVSNKNESKPKNWTDKLVWSNDYGKILDPNLPVAVVTYDAASYTVSNPFEANSVAALAWLYRQILVEQNDGEFDEKEFWNERLGIITPHRAQMSLIRNKLLEIGFTNAAIVDTVDRFQGLERDFIIASYAVADADFIRSEESFILNPRRFNVTLTRPRSKFVMFLSGSLVRHLPADVETAREAAHLQLFVAEYCASSSEISLPSVNDSVENFIPCRLRFPKS
jgi:hypothetical protein